MRHFCKENLGAGGCSPQKNKKKTSRYNKIGKLALVFFWFFKISKLALVFFLFFLALVLARIRNWKLFFLGFFLFFFVFCLFFLFLFFLA